MNWLGLFIAGCAALLVRYCCGFCYFHHREVTSRLWARQSSTFNAQRNVNARLLKHSLLTADEEKQLGLHCKLNVQLKTQLDVLESAYNATFAVQSLTKKLNITEEKLFNVIKRGDIAKRILCRANMRLIFHISKFYHGKGVSKSDLIQEAGYGLVKAIERFEPDKGFRLSTYASWWIKQAVSRAVLEKSRLLRVPVSIGLVAQRLREFQRELAKSNGSFATIEDLASAFNVDVKKVQASLDASKSTLSINQPICMRSKSANKKRSMEDIVSSTACNPSAARSSVIVDDDIVTAFVGLPEKDVELLVMRYGLDDGVPKTLDEVGQRFNLTRERVRQLESNALMHLRLSTKR